MWRFHLLSTFCQHVPSITIDNINFWNCLPALAASFNICFLPISELNKQEKEHPVPVLPFAWKCVRRMPIPRDLLLTLLTLSFYECFSRASLWCNSCQWFSTSIISTGNKWMFLFNPWVSVQMVHPFVQGLKILKKHPHWLAYYISCFHVTSHQNKLLYMKNFYNF